MRGGVALLACPHAMPQKIHDARIGVEYRQSVCVRRDDGRRPSRLVTMILRSQMAVKDESLPLPVVGL